ncbi:MAG TPA: HupE/UreJ family protein [Polyangiaceae bacterium]|jgi:hypothetical protein|nr:HupE/UreJ family protein [Polyangiaceae bacterium]
MARVVLADVRMHRIARMLVLLALALIAAPSSAHSAAGKHIEATTTPTGLHLTVSSSTKVDLDVAITNAWLARGIEVSSAAGPCRAKSERVGEALAMDFVCPSPIHEIELIDRELVDAPSAAQTIVSLDGKAHVLRPGAESLRVRRTSWTSTALSFGREGMVHLLTGYDHLLFVLTLLLAAGMRARQHGLRRALVDAARIVTAFTIGHSITLALASLEVIAAPSALVEAAIAGSIVLAAALNLWRPERGVERAWLALAFGLVHGLGFSSVLAEVGLPRDQRLIALVSFNVGIELAQLAFVAAVIAPLGWLGRQRFYQRGVLVPSSIAISAIAAVWLVQRATGA